MTEQEKKGVSFAPGAQDTKAQSKKKKKHTVPNVAAKMDPKEQERLAKMVTKMTAENTMFLTNVKDEKVDCSAKIAATRKAAETGDNKEAKRTKPMAVFVKGAEGSSFDVNSLVSKVLVQGADTCNFTLGSTILTRCVEVWHAKNVTLDINTEVKTLQLDLSSNLHLKFNKVDNFECIIWNGVEGLKVEFADAPQFNFTTGFKEMKEEMPDSNEVDQFIIRFVEGKLCKERCIRLKNGFLSTEREAVAWQKRNDTARDNYVDKFMKEAGITFSKKDENAAKKQKPNDKCACKSGKKYKKCCFGKKKLDGVSGSMTYK